MSDDPENRAAAVEAEIKKADLDPGGVVDLDALEHRVFMLEGERLSLQGQLMLLEVRLSQLESRPPSSGSPSDRPAF